MHVFITGKRELLRDAWEENTISGVTTFVNNNQWHEGLDDKDTCVANFDVSPGRSRILFASKKCYDIVHDCTKIRCMQVMRPLK